MILLSMFAGSRLREQVVGVRDWGSFLRFLVDVVVSCVIKLMNILDEKLITYPKKAIISQRALETSPSSGFFRSPLRHPGLYKCNLILLRVGYRRRW